MDSLQDLLTARRPEEPEEVTIIKEFLRQHFQARAVITVGQQHVTIQVKNASLAGALRPHLYALKQMCNTQKRLVIRIG